jgi:hypothetical protein
MQETFMSDSEDELGMFLKLNKVVKQKTGRPYLLKDTSNNKNARFISKT